MMKFIEIECYEVYSSYDRDVRHEAYFSNEQLAKEFANNSPYKGIQKIKKTYTIFESLKDADEYSKEKIKQKALEKLTSQEKEVLGLA